MSTPFVHVKWFLEQYGLKEKPIYMINGVGFYFFFLFYRTPLSFYIMYLVSFKDIAYAKPVIQYVSVICTILGIVLNVGWTLIMTKYLYRRFCTTLKKQN